MSPPLRTLLLSPYHGGSHKAWAEGWARRSVHQIEIRSLSDQFWKWRLTGGALRLADEYLERPPFAGERPDLIVATDMLDLPAFLSLTRRQTAGVPVVLYAHENQWTYPLPSDPTTGPMRRQGGEPDRQLAWINVRSMLAADVVAFNSSFHRREFLGSLPAFFRHYPDETDPSWTNRIEEKSLVLPLGIDLQRLDPPPPRRSRRVPLVLWNHRWEYDKDPESFFAAVEHALTTGVELRLAMCGARVRHRVPEFDEAQARYEGRIEHWGYADAETYRRLLWDADVVVSTSRHEFFGISVCEALYCQTMPVLPRSLAYPELIPPTHQERVFYDPAEGGKGERAGRALVEALECALDDPGREERLTQLRDAVSVHDWSRRAPEYDRMMREWVGEILAGGGGLKRSK